MHAKTAMDMILTLGDLPNWYHPSHPQCEQQMTSHMIRKMRVVPHRSESGTGHMI